MKYVSKLEYCDTKSNFIDLRCRDYTKRKIRFSLFRACSLEKKILILYSWIRKRRNLFFNIFLIFVKRIISNDIMIPIYMGGVISLCLSLELKTEGGFNKETQISRQIATCISKCMIN